LNNLTQSHRQAWEAIPWIVNGSASEAQTCATQEHLRRCADCREALEFEQRLYDTLMRPQPNLSDAQADWGRLATRLDSPMDQLGGRGSDALQQRWRASVSIPVRWLVAAVIIEALALGAIVSSSWINGAGRAPVSAYRTLSRPEPIVSAPTIRVVLSPTMTLEQLGVLLNTAHLQIVAGPGVAGVWSLAPAEDATSVATEAALRELRGSPQVRFAEPIDPGVRPLPP
jgi:hypothetical protein